MVEVVKYGATGRRKSSIARVTLMPGTGLVRVNKREFENYFPRETDRIMVNVPLKLTNTEAKFDVDAKVVGGGSTGQAGAIKLGISRALINCDPNNRPVLDRKSTRLNSSH